MVKENPKRLTGQQRDIQPERSERDAQWNNACSLACYSLHSAHADINDVPGKMVYEKFFIYYCMGRNSVSAVTTPRLKKTVQIFFVNLGLLRFTK